MENVEESRISNGGKNEFLNAVFKEDIICGMRVFLVYCSKNKIGKIQ